MTFYYESLTNLIAYSDLRTNVFHEFSQIGNAIIFSLLLEQTLVSTKKENYTFRIVLFEKKKSYLQLVFLKLRSKRLLN